jgi:hypothetical protein
MDGDGTGTGGEGRMFQVRKDKPQLKRLQDIQNGDQNSMPELPQSIPQYKSMQGGQHRASDPE